ncbi:MAG: fatty acid desaturase [Saprospiraceae bacterium]|nr:fatty acid desaturase [Saprospiraceae bacterium]MBK9726851.1 fatty acid desaturase [Saprospiraceae bacterium]
MKAEVQEFTTNVKLALKSIKPYQKTDTKKAVFQIINSVGSFLLIWVAIYFIWDYSFLLAVLLAILNALFLVRIFIIQHDCGHNSFVESSGWRKIIGYSCSMLSSVPYFYWAKSHHFHHMNNGMLEVRDIGDIDTLTVKEFSQLSKFGRFKYRIYRSPIVMFFFGPLYYIFIHNRLPLVNLEEFKKAKPGLWINNLIYIIVIVALCFVLDWKRFLTMHVIILSAFAIIAIWFFYIQHQHEHGYKHWRDKWEFMYAAVKGSSYYKLPAIMNWFTGNIAIHHIHHLNPAIPNYNLKKCVDAIPWFQKYTTEITFWQSLKLATHKLWDESQQRMITFREYYQMEKLGLVKV